MFSTEQEMSLEFEKFIRKNFGNTYIKECPGLSGIPDFLYYTKVNNALFTITFELKLWNWRKGAEQAFRYMSFSNIVYVVLSHNHAKSAIKKIKVFEKYNIGLATFNHSKQFEIIYKPKHCKPYAEQLNLKLINTIGKVRIKSKNISTLL